MTSITATPTAIAIGPAILPANDSHATRRAPEATPALHG
jgi:hypothetical protein